MDTVTDAAGRGRVPPEFRGAPLVGNLLQVRRDRLGLMAAALRAHGDAVRLRMGPRRLYLFNHPDHAKHVLSENHANYHKGLGLVHARRALGDGLLTSEGEVWQRQRRAVQPSFGREQIAQASEVVTAQAEQMLAGWRRQAEVSFDLVPELTRLTLGVLGHSLLRVDLGSSEAIGQAFEMVQDQAMFEMVTLNALPPWLPLPGQVRFRRARRELDRLTARLVREHTARGTEPGNPPGNLLSRLISSTGWAGDDRSRQQLRDELVTLLLAGHETTASTLGWTCHLVAQHPEVYRQLHAEAVAQLGDRRPSYADLARLPYTTQVVEEAIRLYPPVWMLTRRALADDLVGGYHVPAGADVLICLYTLHRNPRFWDRPEVFDPARFEPGRSAARPRYAYLPFGAGPRFCVGNNLGLMEAVLVLAMIAREFRWRTPPYRAVVPEPMLSLRLKGGLPMTLERV